MLLGRPCCCSEGPAPVREAVILFVRTYSYSGGPVIDWKVLLLFGRPCA